MSLDARIVLSSLVLLLCISVEPVPASAAQDPIRVQSDEVLVPTVVFDKEIYAQLNKMKPHHRDSYRHLVAKNEKLWDSIAVKDLTAQDFHVFEDGVEQRIQRVRLEPPAFRVVEGNLGKHPEIVGSGGGLWAYPDTPKTDMRVWLAWPQYVLTYVPKKSPVGSCHQIHVKVKRANLEVWARSEYCNTEHPASDPLSGTEFGKKLEAKANPRTLSDIDLKTKVWALADNSNTSRVYVSLDFPWQALLHEFRDGTLYAAVGLLVMVYRKDGTLAARYSDFACCDYGNEKKSNASEQQAESQHVVAQPDGADALLPDRYEKQFTLPPGDYQVRAVISDGVHFGVQEAPLTVASYDASKLVISDLVLSRRARKLPAEATEAAAQVAKSYTPLISKGVEFTPTPNPQFRPSDTMFAYFEINDPLVGGQPGAKVQVNIRIVDAESGVEVDTFAPVDTTTYSTAGSPLIAVARGVPLKRLKPGVYRLDVQARNVEGKSTEWRSAVFMVMEAAPLELSETAPPKKEEVILNVSALDSSGRPVTDLTNADFQIFEDEKAQTTASLRETSAGKPGAHFSAPVVILFDLLNTHPEEREYVADRIIKTLQPLEAEEGIYVYLLTNDGALVSVRPKGTPQAAAIAQGSIAGESSEKTEEGPPWTKDIRPLLVNAVKQVNGFRLDDYKDKYWRTSLTFQKLDELARDFDIIRGPKTLLWVTSGVPMKTNTPYACEDAVIHRDTSSYVAGKCSQECPQPRAPDMASLMMNCLDYTPFLEHFSAEAAESDTVVSSVAETETGLQDFVPGTAANLLKQLGDSTGGHVYLNTNREMEKAVREAVEASKSRYRLEFTPALRDGKYHKVRVVCTRQSVHIVAPQGYFAPAP